MRLSVVRSRLITALFIAVAAAPPLLAVTVSKQQADVFVRKLAEIGKPNPPAIKPGTRRTSVTEGELNSWFVYQAQPLLPQGVTAPEIAIVGNGKVMGKAVVDLEAVGRRRSSGSALDPWSLLGGRVPLNVSGTLTTKDGVGRFDLEAADISGLPIPKLVVQELLTHYSRSDSRPQGLRLDDPFPLPANIRQIEVGQGHAVVVQ